MVIAHLKQRCAQAETVIASVELPPVFASARIRSSSRRSQRNAASVDDLLGCVGALEEASQRSKYVVPTYSRISQSGVRSYQVIDVPSSVILTESAKVAAIRQANN